MSIVNNSNNTRHVLNVCSIQPTIKTLQKCLKRGDKRSGPKPPIKKTITALIPKLVLPYLSLANSSTILLLIPCAFKLYVKCRYRQYAPTSMSLKNRHPQSSTVITHKCVDKKNTKFLVWLAKALSCCTYGSVSLGIVALKSYMVPYFVQA